MKVLMCCSFSFLSRPSHQFFSSEENSKKGDEKQSVLPVIETTPEGALLGDAYKVTDQIGREKLYIPVIAFQYEESIIDYINPEFANGLKSYIKRADFAKESIRVDGQNSILFYQKLNQVLENVEQHTLQKSQSVKSHFFDFSYGGEDLKDAVDYLESFTFCWLIKEELKTKEARNTLWNFNYNSHHVIRSAEMITVLEELRLLAELPKKGAKGSYLHQARDVQSHVSEMFNILGAFEKRGYSSTLKTAFKTLEVFHNRWT